MRVILPLSAFFGVIWSLIVMGLMNLQMGAGLFGFDGISGLLAGALAGMAAGYHTIKSRSRNDGRERILQGLACYYLSIVVFWFAHVVLARVAMCIREGGWIDFDLRDHFIIIFWFFLYGTIMYGVLLIPLCFLTRHAVWNFYERAMLRKILASGKD